MFGMKGMRARMIEGHAILTLKRKLCQTLGGDDQATAGE